MKEQILKIADDLRNRAIDEQKAQTLLFGLLSVSNWLAFDEIKPESDRLFIITNGSFAEIAYYKNEEIMKPWRYDKHDLATFKSRQNGLKWQYIDLPACC